MHNISDLVFKSVYLFNMNPINFCLFKVRKQNKASNMFTVNKKDTKRITLTTVFIVYSCASVANFEQVIPCWDV